LNTDFVFGSEKNSEFHVSILDYCTFRVEQKVMQKCSDRQSCTVYTGKPEESIESDAVISQRVGQKSLQTSERKR